MTKFLQLQRRQNKTILNTKCYGFICNIIMETADKKYKFINGDTGYVIHYYTCKLPLEKIKQELENVKNWVAVKNRILASTIYWEEIKE